MLCTTILRAAKDTEVLIRALNDPSIAKLSLDLLLVGNASLTAHQISLRCLPVKLRDSTSQGQQSTAISNIVCMQVDASFSALGSHGRSSTKALYLTNRVNHCYQHFNFEATDIPQARGRLKTSSSWRFMLAFSLSSVVKIRNKACRMCKSL